MADEEGGGGGGSSKLIIIIAAVVVLLIAGAAVWFFMFQEKPEEGDEVVEETAQDEKDEYMETPLFLPLQSYVVNLKDGRRYLKATIQLMISNQATYDYLNTRLIEVKDLVLTELQELSTDEIKQLDARKKLRERLINRIKQLFPSDPDWEDPEPIRKVLFEEFYVQ